MATTLTTLFPGPVQFPSTNPANLKILGNGVESFAFDDATNESIIFLVGPMPQAYGGGVLTVKLHIGLDTATTGNTDWDASVEAVADDEQVDVDSFDTINSTDNVTVPGTAQDKDSISITLTNKDAVAVGEVVRIMITRDAASDTASGDALLIAAELQEA